MSSKANITQEQLENFCSVTGTDIERARFYLEAANGDIDVKKKEKKFIFYSNFNLGFII